MKTKLLLKQVRNCIKIKSTSGFTLIEIMISMSILATMALVTSQAIQRSIKNKLKIQSQLDDGSRIRDALRIIEKDISLAFNYRDLEKEMFEQLVRSDSTLLNSNSSGQTGAPQSPASSGQQAPSSNLNTKGPPFDYAKFEAKWKQDNPFRLSPLTQFFGYEDSLYFATGNAPMIYSDQPQADFVGVGYFLAACKSPKADLKDAKCLMRGIRTMVEGDPTQLPEATLLLEFVMEFKLRYLGEGKQDWVSEWKTEGGDGATNGKFPLAVEVSLTLEKPSADGVSQKRKLSYQIVVPLRFPNNPRPTK